MSDDEHLQAEAPKGEVLWTLRKNDIRIHAELRSHGEAGFEMLLFKNGERMFNQRHLSHSAAMDVAIECRRELEVNGWSSA